MSALHYFVLGLAGTDGRDGLPGEPGLERN